jgi:hypothetical protein
MQAMKTVTLDARTEWRRMQEYPHATSYLGDPRSLPPEIDPIIDGFFKRFRDAVLRTGICIRPQRPVRPVYATNVWQEQVADPTQNMVEKIAFAKKRWGDVPCSMWTRTCSSTS